MTNFIQTIIDKCREKTQASTPLDYLDEGIAATVGKSEIVRTYVTDIMSDGKSIGKDVYILTKTHFVNIWSSDVRLKCHIYLLKDFGGLERFYYMNEKRIEMRLFFTSRDSCATYVPMESEDGKAFFNGIELVIADLIKQNA